MIKAAVAIGENQQDKLMIGSLDACVDWGYAPDYVDAMWRILQLDSPADFVVSSGETHLVRELVGIAFEAVGLDWRAASKLTHNHTNRLQILKIIAKLPTLYQTPRQQ